MKSIAQLVNGYIKYLHTNFDIEKLEKNTYRIVTPFLDRRNDNIVIYALEDNNNKIKLTDDSFILNDLEISGLSLSPKREKEINHLLLSYGVIRRNNEIFVETDRNNFAQKKHDFIQAIISINDMYLLSSERVASFFIEDIRRLFDRKKLIYNENISIAGKSHILHKFDFILPKQITSYHKEALIKAINNPKIENIKATLFSFEDITKTGRTDKNFVILNDNKPINKKIYQALDSYNITPLHFTKIEEEFQKLGVAA